MKTQLKQLRPHAARIAFVLLLLRLTAVSTGDTLLRVSPLTSGASPLESVIATLNRLRQDPAHAGEVITIRLSGGTYFLPKKLVISGNAGPLVIESAPGESAILSGGTAIENWKPATFNGHACWRADVPAVRLGIWNFRELWVNGRRATRARHPAHGYLASVGEASKSIPWNTGQNFFSYKPGDVPDKLPTDAEAIILNRWVEARLSPLTVDSSTHVIHSGRTTPFQLDSGDLYWLEGAPQWFDQEGDWYLDRSAGAVYYMPRAKEILQNISAVAPRLSTAAEIRNAKGVTFRRVTFSHTEWSLPDPTIFDPSPVGGFGQAAVGVPAAVAATGSRDCRFTDCHFEHLGNYGLELGLGCQANQVEHCTFTDLGAGGLKIGDQNPRSPPADQAFGNRISDCRITDGGHMFPSACGIWVGESYDNHIEHNEISDMYYSGISMGWTWGLGPSLCKGNIVEGNLIHHLGKKLNGDGPILSDMGGIYTLGVQPGTVIRGNVFHDITGRDYGGWGIYLDEGSSNITVENNLVYRTTHGGFHQNYGRDNLVRNNIFALGRDVQIARTESDPTNTFTFTRNIVYWNSGCFIVTGPEGLTFDGNLYYCTEPSQLKFGPRSWEQWRAAGQDGKTILADPGFRNIKADDFTPSKQAKDLIGFQPLMLDHVGPR